MDAGYTPPEASGTLSGTMVHIPQRPHSNPVSLLQVRKGPVFHPVVRRPCQPKSRQGRWPVGVQLSVDALGWRRDEEVRAIRAAFI